MRRLLRWTFNGVAVVSAVLFAAGGVLWVATMQYPCFLWARAGPVGASCVSQAGYVQLTLVGHDVGAHGIHCAWLRDPDRLIEVVNDYESGSPLLYAPEHRPRQFAGGGGELSQVPDNDRWHHFVRSVTPSVRFNYLAVPHWFIGLCAAVVFALWLVVGRRRRRPPPGHCVCGYDLRATPGRCPECGRIPRRA